MHIQVLPMTTLHYKDKLDIAIRALLQISSRKQTHELSLPVYDANSDKGNSNRQPAFWNYKP
jgi:hypothetical protein